MSRLRIKFQCLLFLFISCFVSALFSLLRSVSPLLSFLSLGTSKVPRRPPSGTFRIEPMSCGPGLLFQCCLLVLLAVVVTGRIPMQSHLKSDRVEHPSTGGIPLPYDNGLAEGISDRRWDTPANNESTSNLIFESLGSLLQTWGNTRRRNGE